MTDQRPLLPVTQEMTSAWCAYEPVGEFRETMSFARFNGMLRDAFMSGYEAHRLTAEQDGWVRVPVEPTPEMVNAGRIQCDVLDNGAVCTWRAMIAAAPPANILDSTKEAGHE